MITVRLLDPALDVKARRRPFTCGDDKLDDWFKRRAVGNQGVYGSTYVAVDGDEIVGFVAVAPSQMIGSAAGGSSEGPSVWPVLLLGRMGVLVGRQGQGIGQLLVEKVFELADGLVPTVGCSAVIVDAKPGKADYYRGLGFEVQQLESPSKDGSTLMYLKLADWHAAKKAAASEP